jgi:maltose alpha-D-glucosyltransferase/alpha-amylase
VLPSRTWFLGRNRTLRDVVINDVVPLPESSSYLLFTDIEYTDGDPDTYLIALAVATGERAEAILRDNRDGVLARIAGISDQTTIVYGAVLDREFANSALSAVVRRRKFKGEHGDLQGGHNRVFRTDWKRTRSNLEPVRLTTDQPSSYIRYGEDFVLKLYRRLEAGVNPDREILGFLTEHTEFCNAPRAVGWLEYRNAFNPEVEPITVGLLTSYTRNGTDGWKFMLDHLGLYFERALAIPSDDARLRDIEISGDVIAMASKPLPPVMGDLLGTYAERVRQLGQRMAELHGALASHPETPAFAPEPFTDFYRFGLYHGMIGQANRVLDALRNSCRTIGGDAQKECSNLLGHENDLWASLHPLRDERITGLRLRIHGDLHLSQLQFTGNDVIIMNFDGDPTRSLTERRIKRSSLRDLACMIRSLHYVSYAVLFGQVPGIVAGADAQQLEKWAAAWRTYTSAVLVKSYFDAAGNRAFLPETQKERRILLRTYMIEKCLKEIMHELEYRPNWLRIPVRGLLDLLEVRSEQNLSSPSVSAV